MAPRRRCPTCGSKQWHKEPSSGLVACSEGHILLDYRNETTEIQEMGPHAMRKRTLKSRREKKGKRGGGDPKLYHGARGRYHYFLSLQLILRKQIAVLSDLWDLPPEFGIICRDLWALHLALLPDPPPDEPYQHARQGDVEVEGEEKTEAEAATSDSDRETKITGKNDGEEEVDRDNEQIKDDDDPEVEEDQDSELEALMRENSEISSSSEEEDEAGATPNVPPKKKRKSNGGRFAYESPVSTVAVLVVACWTMRIPILYRDFTRIIESYQLPYLDPIRFLPQSMVQHLTKHNVQALSPPHAPSTMSMHGLASRLAKKLYSEHGIWTPETNASSILWRITKEMGGTPTLYRMAKRVASALSVPLTLHRTLAPVLHKSKATDVGRHHYDNAPPEVGLVASLLIVLKLVYGLDGKTRVSDGAEDVGCALPRKQEMLKKVDDTRSAMFDSKNMLHVGEMKEEELDDYIAFCTEVLLGQGSDGVLDRYFPVEETRRDGQRRHMVESEMDRQMTRRDVEEDGLPTGGEYKMWNVRDVDGTLPSEYMLLLSRAATVTGTSREYVGGVMEKQERRMAAWPKI